MSLTRSSQAYKLALIPLHVKPLVKRLVDRSSPADCFLTHCLNGINLEEWESTNRLTFLRLSCFCVAVCNLGWKAESSLLGFSCRDSWSFQFDPSGFTLLFNMFFLSQFVLYWKIWWFFFFLWSVHYFSAHLIKGEKRKCIGKNVACNR